MVCEIAVYEGARRALILKEAGGAESESNLNRSIRNATSWLSRIQKFAGHPVPVEVRKEGNRLYGKARCGNIQTEIRLPILE